MIAERPPTDGEVRQALAAYVDAVRAHYGARLVDVSLFGSRARGDATAESDADVVVVLENGDWGFWQEKMVLSRMSHDALIEFNLSIQPWPIARSEWERPAVHKNPRFVENIKRDARSIPASA